MILICQQCGKEMEAKKSTKKYCSQECRNAMRRMQYAEWREENPTKPVSEREYKGNEKKCVICEQNFIPKNAAANMRQCCYECMPEGTQLTRGQFLAKIKEKRGGKCIRCGYDKCMSALEFHHLDPNQKDFTISNDKFKLQEVVKESKKCILICSNCHKEVHAGIWDISELNLKEREEVESNGAN